MGVRGSVELKSIGSVGGLTMGSQGGIIGNGPASAQSNSNNSLGFAWT